MKMCEYLNNLFDMFELQVSLKLKIDVDFVPIHFRKIFYFDPSQENFYLFPYKIYNGLEFLSVSAEEQIYLIEVEVGGVYSKDMAIIW